ncbi:MAG TPA: lmo0937 family membrane protein [Ktedonobacteraceae bacterium]|nr:lmo0937 family membrane protein [Ktedonobacteraceae bacterium]
MSLASIIWTIIVVLFVLLVLGLVVNIGGGLIHLLLVVEVILVIYNLIAGRSRTV